MLLHDSVPVLYDFTLWLAYLPQEQTGRSLIAPRFLKCKEQSLSILFDMDTLSSHVDVIEVRSPTAACV